MKPLCLIPAAVLFLSSLVQAEDKPKPVTRTFYVSGIECGSCVYSVQQSVTETKGVADVTVVQFIDSIANVTFDPKTVSDQQIAQAVREAYPLHGMPYLATLKLRMPGYAQHAAKVDGLFAGWKQSVTMEVTDKAKGELVIHFLPLEVDAKKSAPQGWSIALLTEACKEASDSTSRWSPKARGQYPSHGPSHFSASSRVMPLRAA
ncbi:MAG: heavy-metal-associated domain-containing protein [Prosthecobacter sp.]